MSWLVAIDPPTKIILGQLPTSKMIINWNTLWNMTAPKSEWTLNNIFQAFWNWIMNLFYVRNGEHVFKLLKTYLGAQVVTLPYHAQFHLLIINGIYYVLILSTRERIQLVKWKVIVFFLKPCWLKECTLFFQKGKFLSLTFNNQIPITHSFLYHGGHGRSTAEVCVEWVGIDWVDGTKVGKELKGII